MTKAEKQAIINALENCINREKQLAHDYIKLNPDEKSRRESDASLVICGIQSMYYEILRQLEV